MPIDSGMPSTAYGDELPEVNDMKQPPGKPLAYYDNFGGYSHSAMGFVNLQ